MVTKQFMPVKTNKPLPERYVSMSNAIARAAQGVLKLPEKRALSLALAKTDSMPSKHLVEASKIGWCVKLTADEYSETFDVSSDTAYEQLKDAAESLSKRQITTYKQTKTGLKATYTNWCGQNTYHHGEGWAEINFTSFVAPHLLALRSQFISYKLKHASALRSIYSWRLFECLQSWKDSGVWKPSVDEFNALMEVPPSLLKNFGQVMRRVITPAIKELREKDSYIVEVTLEKSGRKVVGLVFKFNPSPQQTLGI